MNASWVGAIASVASALVVAVTAAAAFMQIRHVRNANDITVYLRLVDRLDAAQVEAAFAAVEPFLERVATDPSFRMQLANAQPVEGEFRQVALLLGFLEHLSTLIISGGVSEQLILAEYADSIVEFWDRFAETVYLRRVGNGPFTGAAFEHLAMRAKDHLDSGAMARFYGRLRRDPAMAGFTPPAR